MKKILSLFLVTVLLLCSGCSKKDEASAAVSSASSSAGETAESAEPAPKSEPKVSEASFFMCGDALLHMTVNSDAYQYDDVYDYSGIVARLKEIASSYDLAYYNQETLLGGAELGYSGYPQFNSPQDWGDYMVDAGFDLVSTANNHCLDRWVDGIYNSLNYWDTKEGVLVAGTNRSQEEQDTIKYGEVNGITYAFLSWCENMNGFEVPEDMPYLVNCFGNGNEQAMIDQVKEAHRNADVVILAIHWGVEYSTYPEEWQQELARELVDAGANIIIGNHPHMIQPIEWIGDSICFYALGNIIAAQYDDSRIGILASLKITKTEDDVMTKIKISDVKADLHYTYYRDYWIDNFDIIPASQMSSDYMWDWDNLYARMSQIITDMDDSIEVGGF